MSSSVSSAPSRVWSVPPRFCSLALVASVALAACGDASTDPAADTGNVSGNVIDATGVGVSGAVVTLSRDGFGPRATSTAETGAFSFADVTAGTWSLEVEPPEGFGLPADRTGPQPVPVTAGATRSVTVELVFLTGSITGTVVDGAGVGVVGARLDLVRDRVADRVALSSGDGSFGFEEVEAGDWLLVVTLPAGAELAPGEASERPVQVRADATTALAVLADRVPTGLADGWELLEASPRPDPVGRHDDIFFLDVNRGWLVNVGGRIYRTRDGGASWQLLEEEPALSFRSVGFANDQVGWVGNLNRFNAPDPMRSLFETRDGGETWQNITPRVTGPEPVGVCGIWVVDEETVYAVGRWQGPAVFLRTTDGGATWQSFDMSPTVTGLIDVYFFDRDRGIIVGGRGVGPSVEAQESSVTVILGTTDGGDTWEVRYEGSVSGKWAWKISFPTPDVGYVATQGPTLDGVVLKTVDGGQTWQELVVQAGLGFSGTGFADADTGWVGAGGSTWETTDGGATWTEVALDGVLNRFRMLGPALGFASGSRAYRYIGR